MLHQIGDQIVINHDFWLNMINLPRFAPFQFKLEPRIEYKKLQEMAFPGFNFQNVLRRGGRNASGSPRWFAPSPLETLKMTKSFELASPLFAMRN
jgi:hypothetical protein